jgi:hypothetical protein
VSLQCEKKVERRVIDTGKPLTILSPKSDIPINSIEWYFGKKPINSSKNLAISFQSVRFIPDYQGEYDIVAELFNEENELIGVNLFKYNAIGSNIDNFDLVNQITANDTAKINVSDDNFEKIIKLDSNIINPTHNEVEIDTNGKIEPTKINNIKEGFKFTIQVYSFPKESQANNKIQKLKKAGFDAYKIEFLHPKYKKMWYRVRVGKFIDYTSANVIAKKIDTHFNISTWIDRLDN